MALSSWRLQERDIATRARLRVIHDNIRIIDEQIVEKQTLQAKCDALLAIVSDQNDEIHNLQTVIDRRDQIEERKPCPS